MLITDKARATVAVQRNLQRKVVRTTTEPRIWPVARWAAELVAGILAILYLMAVLAFGGALLFYTFWH
jgi:hypothetical protein